MATTMARSILLPNPKYPLSSTSVNGKTKIHRYSRISLKTAQRGRSVLVHVATDLTSSENKVDDKNAGSTPPTVVNSSGLSIQFPEIPSTWSTLLIGAAVFFSVPLYRRIKKVQEVVEQAEEAAETAIEAIDKAAEEVGHIASDLAKTSSNAKIREVALKVETIAERIERDAEMAEEVLHKVEHITEEVEELLEPMIEKAECQEKEGKHNFHRSINHNSEVHKSDTE